MSNNKRSMKLYTEADLKKVISIYSEEYKTSTDEILKELNLTPIELPSDSLCINCDESEFTHNICMDCIIKIVKENIKLPSDEEIEKESLKFDFDETFRVGAKWMRNKIQGGNNEQQ